MDFGLIPARTKRELPCFSSCPRLSRASTSSFFNLTEDVDGRAFAAPKRLRPRWRVKPGHDGEGGIWINSLTHPPLLPFSFRQALPATPAVRRRCRRYHWKDRYSTPRTSSPDESRRPSIEEISGRSLVPILQPSHPRRRPYRSRTRQGIVVWS